MDKIKNSFFETVGRWVLCNEGFGSAFFFYKAGEIREMKDALAVISGRTDVFLYLRIVEILYFISEQLWKDGLRKSWWVKWYLCQSKWLNWKTQTSFGGWKTWGKSHVCEAIFSPAIWFMITKGTTFPWKPCLLCP